jgi:hypothetical protein
MYWESIDRWIVPIWIYNLLDSQMSFRLIGILNDKNLAPDGEVFQMFDWSAYFDPTIHQNYL